MYILYICMYARIVLSFLIFYYQDFSIWRQVICCSWYSTTRIFTPDDYRQIYLYGKCRLWCNLWRHRGMYGVRKGCKKLFVPFSFCHCIIKSFVENRVFVILNLNMYIEWVLIFFLTYISFLRVYRWFNALLFQIINSCPTKQD